MAAYRNPSKFCYNNYVTEYKYAFHAIYKHATTGKQLMSTLSGILCNSWEVTIFHSCFYVDF